LPRCKMFSHLDGIQHLTKFAAANNAHILMLPRVLSMAFQLFEVGRLNVG
jgi:hypothetical protein